jgi:hypothetical protein
MPDNYQRENLIRRKMVCRVKNTGYDISVKKVPVTAHKKFTGNQPVNFFIPKNSGIIAY